MHSVDAGVAVVISASIGLVGSVLVTLIQKSRQENKEDHATVVDQQRVIYRSIINIEKKLDNHISDHVRSEITNRTTSDKR